MSVFDFGLLSVLGQWFGRLFDLRRLRGRESPVYFWWEPEHIHHYLSQENHTG